MLRGRQLGAENTDLDSASVLPCRVSEPISPSEKVGCKKKTKSPFCSPTEMFLDQTREDESGKQKAYCPVLALRSLNTHMVVSCSWGD